MKQNILNNDFLRLVYDKVKKRVDKEVPNYSGYGRCVAYASIGQEELKNYGVDSLIVAGSAHWPLGVEDDGICDTHFGYVFGEQTYEEMAFNLIQGVLPEIHTWLMYDSYEKGSVIIDFSTNEVPLNCKKIIRSDMLTPIPDFAHFPLKNQPKDWLYIPDITASKIIKNLF